MSIGSQGLKTVAGLALAAIVFAGLASCSAAVLPDGAREVPDLMVSSPSASAGAPAAGTTFTLSVVVSNQGEGAAAAATLRYYRSTDATITSSDTEVGKDTVAQLAGSGSSSQSVELTAPASPGAYYYGACVDPVTDESDTTNNCSTSVPVTVPETETEPQPGPEPEPEPDPERHPDLVVTAPSVSDSNPAGGAQFTLSATVRNAGEGAAAVTMLRYYRSTDAAITTTDTEVGTDPIGELAAAESSSKSVDLTAPTSPATYYYGACVDPVTDETDTTNNCSASVPVTVPVTPQSVEVTPGDVTFASLGATAALTARVLDAQDNEILGEAVSWSSNFPEVATVDAAGTVTAVANGIATVTASASGVSGEATVTVWQRAASAAIDPGEVELTSVGATATVTLRAFDANGHEAPDAGDITSWRWRSANWNVATVHPFPVIDPRAQVRAVGAGMTEVTVAAMTEDGVSLNATTKVTVTIAQYPDLEVETTVSDETPETGASFTLSATVSNAGDGESPATTLTYYQSTDATITTADTSVGTDDVGVLSASGTSEQSISLTAPSSPATYYYGACVDAADESDTTNNCSDSVQVTVSEPEESALSVEISAEDDKEWAPVGDTVDLSARVLDDEGEEITGTTVTWSSSNIAVATVDSSGVMTAEGEGTVTLTATATVSASSTQSSMARSAAAVVKADQTVTGSVRMIVVKRAARIDVSPASLSFDSVGDFATLTATIYDQDDNVMQPTYWAWSSADRAVATVEGLSLASGIQASVQAIGEGTTKVTLSANGSATGTAAVTVAAVTVPVTPQSVEVTPGDVTFASLGATAALTARVLDAQDNEIFGEAVSWSSNFPEVATVDAAGVVTAVANGRTKVSASASGVSGEATVTVWQRAASAAIDPGEVELTSVGETATVTLRAFDANGHEAPDAGDIRSWRWRSANWNVATVHPFPVIDPRAQVRAVGAGMTDVTVAAETEDGVSLNATTKVTVTIPQYPDLEVETTVSDETPETGASFTLSATVSNAGDGESPTTTLTYYQSTDATITTADTSVGTDDVGVLSASATSEESISLTAPSSPGVYYYGACVEAVTDESDTTNNCSDSVPVTVSEPEESALSVEISAEDDKEWAPVGDTVDLSARVLDDEGEEITGTTVRWSSSNPAVATVDSSGVMTAVGEGTVTLTATATVSASSTQSSMARSGAAVVKADQTVSGSVSMIVVKRAARIDISPASLSFDSVGETAALTATVYDEDDNVMRPTYWGWSSADRAVATASNRIFSSQTPQAHVTAIGEGTTTVSVSVNGSATGTASVTVTLPVARVEVSPIELDFEALGDTKTVTVRVLDENGDEDEVASFTAFTVFHPCCNLEPGDPIETVHVARVDDSLEVTAEGTGSGRIKISSPDVEPAFVLVRVYQVPKSLTLSPDSASLAVGETATLRASVMDANGHDIRLAEGLKGGLVVYWETSDPDVATVDGADHDPDRNTGATATITAAAAGTATITGRHGIDVTGTATITVTDSS